MTFFIPEAKDKEQEQQVYSAIKGFLEREFSVQFDGRKVRLLNYVHAREEIRAEVGEPHGPNDESVIAILHEPRRKLYHVCTAIGGVATGGSVLIDEHLVRAVEDFDSE